MSFLSGFDSFDSPSPLEAASRFDACFDVFGLSLKQATARSGRSITLIAKSPASPAARALGLNLPRFERASLDVRVILAGIAPIAALDLMLEALRTFAGVAPETMVRWAKNRALLDAHERLTLGDMLCWTGDAMRRTEDARIAIDRIEDASPALLAEANASFSAIWKASKPLPGPDAGLRAQSIGVAGPDFTAELPGQASRDRLDAYLRLRRH